MQLVLAVSHWTARKRPHVIDGHEGVTNDSLAKNLGIC